MFLCVVVYCNNNVIRLSRPHLNSFREYSKLLNPKYHLPSRETLASTLVPARYDVEKSNLAAELKGVAKAAITADGWTAFSQDHYLTVTLHYISNGQCREKVPKTLTVYEAFNLIPDTATCKAEEDCAGGTL